MDAERNISILGQQRETSGVSALSVFRVLPLGGLNWSGNSAGVYFPGYIFILGRKARLVPAANTLNCASLRCVIIQHTQSCGYYLSRFTHSGRCFEGAIGYGTRWHDIFQVVWWIEVTDVPKPIVVLGRRLLRLVPATSEKFSRHRGGQTRWSTAISQNGNAALRVSASRDIFHSYSSPFMSHYNLIWRVICSILFKCHVGLLHLAVELIQKIGDYVCVLFNQYYSSLTSWTIAASSTRPEVITTCLLLAQPMRGAHGSLLHCIRRLQSRFGNNDVPARDTGK